MYLIFLPLCVFSLFYTFCPYIWHMFGPYCPFFTTYFADDTKVSSPSKRLPLPRQAGRPPPRQVGWPAVAALGWQAGWLAHRHRLGQGGARTGRAGKAGVEWTLDANRMNELPSTKYKLNIACAIFKWLFSFGQRIKFHVQPLHVKRHQSKYIRKM